MASTILSGVAILISALSLGWQAYSWRLGGARMTGWISVDGGDVVVHVINIGRSAALVTAVGIPKCQSDVEETHAGLSRVADGSDPIPARVEAAGHAAWAFEDQPYKWALAELTAHTFGPDAAAHPRADEFSPLTDADKKYGAAALASAFMEGVLRASRDPGPAIRRLLQGDAEQRALYDVWRLTPARVAWHSVVGINSRQTIVVTTGGALSQAEITAYAQAAALGNDAPEPERSTRRRPFATGG